MGTISDKLMRIINTKEDIRQALISKGYDVPTSIPFKEYAKMILDLPCNADSFPDIEGIVARYSASGLTNEQMAANPVWVDKTGNGHDLQLKNFAWGGMSGVGGYVDNWNSSADWAINSYWVNSHTDHKLQFITASEQLPLYPGFILGDGVDDFAVTEKELNFEDTYTVYTAFIPFQNNPTRNMILCGADSKKTFSMQYPSLVYVSFIAGNNYYINADFVNGLNLFACKRNGNNICIKNLLTNKVVTGTCGDWVENAGLYYLWKNATYASFAKAAIAGQTICNGYFSTDEDDEKVLDWYKKQYSWLFPDQAWTVVGKTNEDEDRATIANITGNGNDLVLSNSGFAEGSGYGLYAENYAGGRWVQSTDRADLTWTSYSVNITSVKVASTQLYYQSYPEQPSFIVPSYKIKVYGLKDGQTLSYRQATSEGQQLYKISEDGTYTLPSFPFKANGDWYGFTLNKVQESCDITIEQIPEYEGYLVTDGVDDKITSSTFEMGNDWTVIGDWELINTGKNDNAGIVKFDSIVIYNYNPILINIKNGRNNLIPDQNTVNAICSDGRIYSKDWKESIYNEETESTSKNLLTIGYSGNTYTKIAFKNLAIYPTVLSKEDCIKAYNYLQTLKSK